MERIINILVITDEYDQVKDLKKILIGRGNNLIFLNDKPLIIEALKTRQIGIILVNIENKTLGKTDILSFLRSNPNAKDAYKIAISKSFEGGLKHVNGLNRGAVDYITYPFNAKLVKAKIEVFKSLYFKSLRISQLLENIFPRNILLNYNTTSKFSPVRIEKGVVLFTDFVAFTRLSKALEPIQMVQTLSSYFGRFDEIVERYNLEKIKTIGDAYMALAGVTEDNQLPSVRATLAALEIKDYVVNQQTIDEALGKPIWNIRIGIHSGPLVAGVIGGKKASFDVWGDSVNIAARAEQNSKVNNITVTANIINDIQPYFNITNGRQVEIKHGGIIDIFQVESLKTEHSLFGEGKLPNRTLRIKADLIPMDFESMRDYMMNKLKSSLPEELDYHNIKHTINVEKAAVRFARLEGVSEKDLILLRTAVIFHDSGYIVRFSNNKEYSQEIARSELPHFGYDQNQIDKICNMIEATKSFEKPKGLLEKIICDANYDFLGRANYHQVAKTIRNELANLGERLSELEWIDFQLILFVDKHRYFTETAQNIRKKSKKLRIKELKDKRETLLSIM